MISTLIFDLETSDLQADRGVILCASYESSEEPRKIRTIRQDDRRVNPNWDKSRGNDREIVRRMSDVIRAHDVIVAHNGTRFDLPYLRTRALAWGLPPLLEVKIVDPCTIAWRKFKLRSNSLGVVADHLGIRDKKTPLDMSLWMDATLNGNRKAMDNIVEHCEADIRVLRGVLRGVRPFIRQLDDRGSAL